MNICRDKNYVNPSIPKEKNGATFATSALSLSLRAWHATVSLARRGTHDVLVLRKGTGAVTLGGAVDRAQLFCQKWTTLLSEESVRSSQATAPRAGRVPTTAKI